MNISTLRKLAKNPHYKLSEKQREELSRAEGRPVMSNGAFEKQDFSVVVHPFMPTISSVNKKPRVKYEKK